MKCYFPAKPKTEGWISSGWNISYYYYCKLEFEDVSWVSTWLNNWNDCHCLTAAVQAKIQWSWKDQDHRQHIYGSNRSECCAQPGACPGTDVSAIQGHMWASAPPIGHPWSQNGHAMTINCSVWTCKSQWLRSYEKRWEFWRLLRNFPLDFFWWTGREKSNQFSSCLISDKYTKPGLELFT